MDRRLIKVAQHQRWIVLITSFAALTAACGNSTAGVPPKQAPIAVPSATLGIVASPTPGATPTRAQAIDGEAIATLTLGTFGQADGPGLSVRDAIAASGAEPLLVNGILLQRVDGSIWLCSTLATSAPPSCAEPRLLVKNWLQPPDDQTFVSGVGLHEEAGVHWIERTQLFGVVHLTP